jgi:hypothetical protein
MTGWPNNPNRSTGQTVRVPVVPAYIAVAVSGWLLAGLYMTGTLGNQVRKALLKPLPFPPPAPALVANQPKLSGVRSIRFTLRDARPGVTFRCSLDGGPFRRCTSPVDYGGLRAGGHVFRAVAVTGTDVSSPAAYGWRIVLGPPIVRSVARTASRLTNAPAVTWTVTFDEPVTGVAASDFAPAGSGAAAASIAGVTGTGASYTVTATTGRDGTLGLSLVRPRAIEGPTGRAPRAFRDAQPYTVDRTPPPRPQITVSGAAFVLTDRERGVTYLCSLDGAAFEPCARMVRHGPIAHGTHSLRVEALDAVGNTSGVASYSWVVPASEASQSGAASGSGTSAVPASSGSGSVAEPAPHSSSPSTSSSTTPPAGGGKGHHPGGSTGAKTGSGSGGSTGSSPGQPAGSSPGAPSPAANGGSGAAG